MIIEFFNSFLEIQKMSFFVSFSSSAHILSLGGKYFDMSRNFL